MSEDAAARRLDAALELYELGESIMREQLRRRHPHAADQEIERLLVQWLRTRPGAEDGDAWGRPVPIPENRS